MNTNTEQKTVYILQKDLPDYKAGEKFTWHEASQCYSAQTSDFIGQVGKWPARYVENNIEWFLPEQPKEREDVVRNNIASLTIDEIIDEIRRHCDGTYSIDPQDWDLPRKASEIIEPLKKLAEQVAPKLPKTEQPKEWEIVAYIHNSTGMPLCKSSFSKAGWDEGFGQNESYSILSVRRLSDGETFSVGEKVGYKALCVSDVFLRPHLISEFVIDKGTNIIFSKGTVPEPFMFALDGMAKLPPPTPKEETIKVLGLRTTWEDPKQHWFNHVLDTSGPIPESKHELIKKAIELILNN